MKKIGILLILSLFLTLCLPMAAAVEADEGAYIVKLKDSGADSVRLMEAAGLEEVYSDAGLYRAESLEDVRSLGGAVEYYEPDAMAKLFALTNDEYSAEQWSLEYTGADVAWDKGYTGEGIRVAIIDSGVNSMHEDFEGTDFEKGANMMDGSHDVTDEQGHGTFVSGLLAAVKDNLIGIAGLCDEIVIIPIKCFGKSVETNTSYVVASIYEAIDVYNCDIINLSLGVDRDLNSMRQAVDYAESKGVIVISAVGNGGDSILNYPAAYSNVIGVGAVDQNGHVASFSQKNSSVFVTAPGVNLLSTWFKGENSYKKDGSGTSYAAPLVAAAAVYMKQHNRSADVDDFKNILMESVTDAGAAGYDTSYGYGIISLGDFVTAAEYYSYSSVTETFPDVAGHWAESNIEFCVNKGYFKGVSENRFAPEVSMNRAMFVTVLSRVSGESLSGYPNPFTDVPADAYYAHACAWGAATKIVNGIGDGTFQPEANVTREQIAVFLYRYALTYNLTGAVSGTSALNSFTDRGSVSGYAREAMAWAVENGFINGRTATTLVPGDSARRAEIAAIIERFAVKYDI